MTPLTMSLDVSLDDPTGLKDGIWDAAEVFSLVDVRTGLPPRWATEVQLVATMRALWVRFRCIAGSVQATMSRYKDKVCQEDAVEVYLRPPGEDHLFEFQLNPIGTFRDLRVWNSGLPGQRYDDSWSCGGASTEARIDRADGAIKAWWAMFKLPWHSLDEASPKASRWGIGLFRIERDPLEYSSLVSCPSDEVDLHDPKLLASIDIRPG